MKYQKGMTLPELIVSLGILTILFSLTTITLLRSQRVSQTQVLTDTILTDIRDQQNKAMAQNTSGNTVNYNFGVHLEIASYTLFRGDNYSANDPNNFVVQLEPGLLFSGVTLPSSQVVFKGGSGEILNYLNGSNSFVVEDTTGSGNARITLNRYGVPLE